MVYRVGSDGWLNCAGTWQQSEELGESCFTGIYVGSAVPDLIFLPSGKHLSRTIGPDASIDFESHRFNEMFDVISDDKRFASAILTPRLMDHVLGLSRSGRLNLSQMTFGFRSGWLGVGCIHTRRGTRQGTNLDLCGIEGDLEFLRTSVLAFVPGWVRDEYGIDFVTPSGVFPALPPHESL